ncbi:hypothetical protein NrS5_11 [Nitratiruptor phage NrS-5]|uniref:hypothetical protein n=1 Tax=unclassified Nitratiruptor TaxID=2624044 RepID=UPI0019162FFF|nr:MULTISPECIES: hypothetical protein [unclassified Nitratiruptor]BCD61715.1 hypothetical protein NitYY0813_C0575 [Nitratiruptor sp. YY08-13]BCD65650.1 hypothetical protein NitYY0826_C0577 [Nitratiruptor sp. YY08-26]BCD83193.1 hypothetical protein NrS4_11 [Nitratiruptor phage NrS-4]BCD83252.1 hypothetical protein NrS5_11 [Nitratiruptor phage NrS-5]
MNTKKISYAQFKTSILYIAALNCFIAEHIADEKDRPACEMYHNFACSLALSVSPHGIKNIFTFLYNLTQIAQNTLVLNVDLSTLDEEYMKAFAAFQGLVNGDLTKSRRLVEEYGLKEYVSDITDNFLTEKVDEFISFLKKNVKSPFLFYDEFKKFSRKYKLKDETEEVLKKYYEKYKRGGK